MALGILLRNVYFIRLTQCQSSSQWLTHQGWLGSVKSGVDPNMKLQGFACSIHLGTRIAVGPFWGHLHPYLKCYEDC